MIEFDPGKDEANLVKHGISLARASDLELLASVRDERFEEIRYRAYGLIDGANYCLAYTIRDGRIRAISLRRAHSKEMNRYVEKEGRARFR